MEEFLKINGALYDETRVLILAFLQKYGTSCVCDLQEAFCMGQSRLSRHLKILKEAGFLEVEKKGKWSYYTIKEELDSYRRCALEAIATLSLPLPSPKKECRI